VSEPANPLKGFENLSPARQKLLLRRLEERRKREETIPRSPRREGDGRFPLSFAQRRLWFLSHLEPGQPAYHLPYALRLTGPLDLPALAAALDGVVGRHEALRTVFELADGEPWQRVLPAASAVLPRADLSALPATAREKEARRLAAADALRPFDVDRGPHLRALLLRLEDETHDLLFTMHHLVSDGWSMGVLVREVGALYAAVATGRPAGLPELAVQYPDYADWQWQRLPEIDRQLAWWKEQLAGLPGTLELPADHPRPAVPSGRGGHVNLLVAPERTESLRAIREKEGDTLFMLLLSTFAVLLRRMTGQDDFAVGTPVANRSREELEPLIGFFVNTLVLRIDTSADPSFRELVGRVRDTTLGAFGHQDLPFEKLVEELRPARDLSRTPLFQVMLSLQNAWERETPTLPGLRLEATEEGNPTSKFDLTLGAAESADGLSLTLEYSTDLFDKTTAQRLMGHLATLLAAVSADPGRPLSELSLWTEAERHQVLVDWNDTPDVAIEGPATLHELVIAQAERTPDAIALAAGDEALTYGELRRRAGDLAERLRERGAGPEQVVAVRLPRAADLIVALLGVLESGAAYLPLDPAYPQERIDFMLEDAGAGWVVEAAAAPPSPPLPRGAGEGATALPSLQIVPANPSNSVREGAPSPAPRGRGGEGGAAAGLAYLIYTSGSTGRPKGVAIEHRSAVALVRWARTVFSAEELAGVLASTSVSFDLSIFEIFVPLASGGRVVLVEDALRLRDLPPAAGVTLVNTVPSALDALLRAGGLPASVRTVNLAGEPIPRELAERVLRISTVRRLLNLYGPSEDTTYSTWAAIDDPSRPAPIGRPVAGTRVHLLDADLQPVPVGAPGHLHLGGDGLARGYLRRPELTAERFVPDPFASSPGDRLYRTGDLARRRADGTLEYLGRIDQQVKVRGFRIEPGEIEAVLEGHPGVREAAVGVWTAPSGDRRLVAWVAGDIPAAELRGRLAATLPAPLIPSAFVSVAALPRTANGKLDRKALPAPEAPVATSGTAPVTETERAVAAIWRDVLGVESVGVNDNFFDLGGHSLLLVRVHDRLRRDLDVDLPLVDLFRYPDVASLARRLRGTTEETPAPAPVLAPRSSSRDIAIIGMAGRFPGAADLGTFWRNLREGVESITRFSREELLASGLPADLADHPSRVPAYGHLEGVELFDAAFFDFSPREAQTTDPQHRLFLECAAEALETAGQDPVRTGARVGVWAGMAFSGYAVSHLLPHAGEPGAPGGLELMIGNDKDYVATRVSYKLDLRGPAMTVQTACSSSLVAVHLACRSLLDGECEMALAGGVAVHLPQRTGYVYEEGAISSPDGHCRSFDAEARGTVGGDGAGVVLLKPLEAALADGDQIHAVIRGTALSNDGAGKVGFTAPSVEGQARAIASAQAAAGVTPETIQMVEAHGSATPLGDPIEVAALNLVFGRGAGPRTCALGSVKSNVGHLDAAAGVTGLIKTVLALKHREIPPSLHFTTPNPRVDFDGGPFWVHSEVRPWPVNGTPRRAGVSSFGLGGTNAHVVLEEAPIREPDAEPGAMRTWQLMVLSTRTESALEAATDRLAEHLVGHPEVPLADAAWTLQAGRRSREHRRAVVVRSTEEAARALSMRDPRRLLSGERRAGDRPVAFVFPGLGEQYGGMGAGLYREEPVFREAVDRCAEILLGRLGHDVRDIREILGLNRAEEEAGGDAPAGPDLRRMLRRGGAAERADKELTRTGLAQPAVFVLEYALAQLWLSWGVRPQALIGYSLGEYVAACVAGVFSLEDALALVAERARWIEELPAGAMLAVGLPPEEIEPLLGEALSLAAVNGPRLCVVAGPPAAVADLEARLAARGEAFRPVETTHAFHSRMMLPVAPRLTGLVRTIERRPPRIPCLSNVTGGWMTATDALDAEYWSRHLTGPVRFAEGIAELWKEPARVLVEVGPGGSLTSMALQHLVTVDPAGAGDRIAVRSLPSLHEHRQGSDRAYLLNALAKLWIAGVEPDWTGLHAGERRLRVELPAYPFERKRFWVDPPKGGTQVGVGVALPEGEEWTPSPTLPRGTGEGATTRPDSGRPESDQGSATGNKPQEGGGALSRSAGEGWGGGGGGSFWLLADPLGLAQRLRILLESDGARVQMVVPGDRFDRTRDRAWTVRPGNRADLASLLAATGWPEVVLHLWALDGDGGSGLDAFERREELGVRSALGLLRTLGENAERTVRVLVGAAGLWRVRPDEETDPALASLPGLCEAAARAHPGLSCRAVDLLPSTQGNGSGREAWAAEMAERLLDEALHGEEPATAWRGGERLIRRRRPPTLPGETLAEGGAEIPGALGGVLGGHARPNLRNAYVAPDGEIERSLAAIWQRLLGIQSVGRHDSFFEMGGHSLLATQLTARLRESFGVSLPMAALFENPTVADLAALIVQMRREGQTDVPPGAVLEIVPDPDHRFEPFPLTDIQQAYWLGRGAAFELGNVGAHVYQELDFTGLDLERLAHSLRRTIDRHDMLRASFLPDGRQRVLPQVPPYQIPLFDLTGLPAAAREEALLAIRAEMSHQVFNPARWPLFEFRAARLDAERIRVFFGIDVLIGDGWSFTVLGHDLSRFYLEPDAEPEPLEVFFRDYVLAEAALRETEAYRRSLAYWMERLPDLPPAPELPMTMASAALETPHFRRRTTQLDAATWKRLKERGTRAGVTPSSLLLAAFAEVLAAWSKSPRLTINLTLFNRPPVHPQINDIVGDFTSLTLLGVDASQAGGFEARARAVQERLWQDLEHRAVSGVRVLRELSRLQGGRPAVMPVIFTSALNLQPDAPVEPAEEAPDPGIRAEAVWGVSQTPQVWLDHQVGETPEGALTYNWDVVEELFPDGMIDSMFAVYHDLLRRLADDEAAWSVERRRLIPTPQLARRVMLNSTGAPLSHDRLHVLFAAQAAQQPDRPAVLAPGRTLTYGELFRLSNRLGRHLRELGAKPNTLIAVVQEKGWEQVVSVLGILASGAAYLPLEPGLPTERLHQLLERGEVRIAVTTEGMDAILDWPEGIERVVLDSEGTGLPTDDSPVETAQRVSDLAYVIFTSGSTGQPKGVMIDHRGAVNTILDVNRTWNVGPDDRVLALSSLSFDLSVWDIFGMLAAGGAIVLPRADLQREPAHWADRIRREKVTVWNTVPALLRMLVDVLETAGQRDEAKDSPLRLALLSGDWIPLDLPDRARALAPQTQVVSLGGATEASIWSIWYPIGKVDPSWKSIPYGRPMANQTFHVLDDRLEPRPDLVPGNLYIGGIGLAKGYWRDPEKTAASFAVHPETGERLYRTGDLGRYLPDGTIEFLGREDFQVKIQGYRIELGEIEAALADHPGVRTAVVAASGERMGTKRLLAYVVPAASWSDGLADTFRGHLRARLPEYMVPALFIPLDALPLGPNGKLDRRALPTPEQALASRDLRPLATETEKILAGVWSEVLHVPQDRIGRGGNFYELGGDSLLATQVMARVDEALGVAIPLQTFFEAITLEAQAQAIDAARPQGETDTDKLARLAERLQNASPEEVERLLAELQGMEGMGL
jgi:amino acid adenylation domain-containing protein